MALSSLRVGILGLGTMGAAMATGLLKRNPPPSQIMATVNRPERVEQLAEKFNFPISTDNEMVASQSDVLLLCTKPGKTRQVLRHLETSGALSESKPLVVSIAAGLRLSQLQQEYPRGRVVRAMPNTPCLIGEGMTVVSTGEHTTADDNDIALSLFRPMGRVLSLGEEHMDVVTGLAASGVAFNYVFIEAMSEGGVMCGLPRQEATVMAAQAMIGAARMVLESNRHPAELKSDVTTPAGCTMSALLQLEDGRVRSILARGIQEAARAASQLGD